MFFCVWEDASWAYWNHFSHMHLIYLGPLSRFHILSFLSSGLTLGCVCSLQRRWWHHTPVLLPGKSRGRRSLVGCSPWGREESDMTELLHFPFSLSCIGEGNGNPLQCSCLENPRDGGAWWAAVSGVTQSWTWLKPLSSSRRLTAAKKQIFFSFLSSLRAHQLTLEGCNCWWLGHPC